MKKPFFLFILLLLPLTCFGWWEAGHMAIAKIAYERLDPDVKKEVDRLTSLFSSVFPNSPDPITAACWADDLSIAGLKVFFHWHGSAQPYNPDGILSAEEVERAILRLEGRDVIWAIQQCIRTLESPDTHDWSKALMLRMLLHIVGDIHQPLHCATLYSSQFPKGDTAGTRYLIQWDGHEKSTLHAYWDSLCGLGTAVLDRPLTEAGKEYLEALVTQIVSQFPEEHLKEVAISDPIIWHAESYRLASACVYQGISPGERPSSEYETRGQGVASQRIALAGYRLGKLLNSTLKASSSLSRP